MYRIPVILLTLIGPAAASYARKNLKSMDPVPCSGHIWPQMGGAGGRFSDVKTLAFLTPQRPNKAAQYLSKYFAAGWDDLMHRPYIWLKTRTSLGLMALTLKNLFGNNLRNLQIFKLKNIAMHFYIGLGNMYVRVNIL